jgi:hypothetical protein
MLPPLALLLARGLASYLRAARIRKSWRTLRAAGVATGAFLLGLAALLYRAMPVIVSVEPWLVALGATLVAVAGLGLAALSVAGAPVRVPLATALAGALALAGLQYGLSPAGRDPVQEVAAHLLTLRGGGERVGTYHVFVRNLVFYTHVPTVDLTTRADLREFLRSRERVLCVMRARDVESLRAEVPGLRVLRQVPYLRASAVRLRTFFSPDPARDLDSVVLVANR